MVRRPCPCAIRACFHGLADVLHAAQHRADGDELGVERIGHQPRDGGLAGARRAPEDAAVGLAGLEGDAQGHAFAQQVLLADHLAQGQALASGAVADKGALLLLMRPSL
jgi:hypothetical protein